MIHDGKTKVIARLHTKFSPRALNIYNPYFEETGVNAVFLLFQNPDPKPLIEGMKSLGFSGAVSVGFETDPNFAQLMDELDETSKIVGHIGFVKNIEGKLRGFYQGGKGELLAIQSAIDVAGKDIVLVGAGNVAKALVFEMSKLPVLPKSVTILNRTIEKLEGFKKYPFVKSVGGLEDLQKASGDILVNATPIGVTITDVLYTEDIVKRFIAVSDVTFEKEDTNLVLLAKKLDKKFATGWDMFTYQGLVVLEGILDIKVDPIILKKHVIAGLSQTVK